MQFPVKVVVTSGVELDSIRCLYVYLHTSSITHHQHLIRSSSRHIQDRQPPKMRKYSTSESACLDVQSLMMHQLVSGSLTRTMKNPKYSAQANVNKQSPLRHAAPMGVYKCRTPTGINACECQCIWYNGTENSTIDQSTRICPCLMSD